MTESLNTLNSSIRHAIKRLEGIDFIPALDRAFILLVANGDKPSMHTGFFTEPTSDKGTIGDSDINDINKITDIITSLGLRYKIEARVSLHHERGTPLYTTRILFCVARDIRTVDQLLDARKRGDYAREGIMLGYPESAVAAYMCDSVIEVSQWPSSTEHVTAEDMVFLSHMISKDNWKEEIKYLPRYAQATKLISKKIYDQCQESQ